ncbi:hypothetical protein M431DRAFT_526227 [Trichoderma harzianum CBS 226.95]|uniref:Zn(2)-C6 fungal-type domain-containing protein n=1 Tax=Trichoderma harzianum CBS 226.95 TaxID=983964 RepID=A0A2T4AS88_TRIHA|nr:hypothetical protein M431DRAFT_526227 [Trichoderma harzianum CBS 226.95]PTB59939.1 hypothetical protein M431DRAFT_526227 [Trichoderma harzianum CBS 226.95]
MLTDLNACIQNENTSSPPLQHTSPRSRVRTGCLICRARKIKCDEQRPNCQRCSKAKRKCVYKRRPPLMPLQPAPPNIDNQQHKNSSSNPSISSQRSRTGDNIIHGHLLPPDSTCDTREAAIFNTAGGMTCSNHEDITNFHQESSSENADSPSARFYTTSLQIYVTTAIDLFYPSGITSRSSSYFIDQVDSPTISAFDYLNWNKIKLHIVQLGTQDPSVAAAIEAVQGIYRAQVNRLAMFHATSEYQARLATFEPLVADEKIDSDTILAISLLLCLCEVILPNEDGSSLSAFGPAFEARLTIWLLNTDRSPMSLRICAWLQLLHVATKRSGSCGLIPETTFDLISNHITEVPNLPPLSNSPDSTSAMYDIISAPIFSFYLQLQRISNEIQDLSHYRRSRITPEDQEEVTEIVANLNNTLSTLWIARPSPLQFQPGQLRENFCPMIAEPLIALVGICTAAYYGEVVGLRRTLGDDPFPSPESQQPMSRIRDIIEGEWNALSKGALNPGYIRPLFLYCIENLEQDKTEWAVARLRQVQSPISRSEFIAALGEALGREQRTEKRRVATKYFCNGAFNAMVPRM